MAIFDCFSVYNELDVLEVRFKILSPYIDYFVLVESSKTYHGEDKPFYFYENRMRYSEWLDKIIYVQVTDAPEYRGETDMGIENFQRNCIMRGLVEKARPDDYVIVSDVDEIINPTVLQDIQKNKVALYTDKGNLTQKMRQHFRMWSMFSREFARKSKIGFTIDTLLNYTPIGLQQDLFYYYMNCRSKDVWRGPYIAKYAHMMMPQEPREMAYSNLLPVIPHAGWHFSYLGGIDAVRKKLAVISDPNLDIEKKSKEAGSNDEYIQKCLDQGIDILGRKGKQFEYQFITPEEIKIPNLQEIKDAYPHFFRL